MVLQKIMTQTTPPAATPAAPQFFIGDLSAEALAAITRAGSVAVDGEMMGLNPHRDRLCLLQLATADGAAYLVNFQQGAFNAPHLVKLFADKNVLKIFHFGRMDIAFIQKYLGVRTAPVYCTKIASKLSRTFTDRHGLKDLCKELLGVVISKQEQTSDWGAPNLTAEQLAYAAQDVLHLHALKEKFDVMLAREGRTHLAEACFDFLPFRAELDLAGWPEIDIFEH